MSQLDAPEGAGDDKIWIKPRGTTSQGGGVALSTNILDMFLFPTVKTYNHGRITVHNREQLLISCM